MKLWCRNCGREAKSPITSCGCDPKGTLPLELTTTESVASAAAQGYRWYRDTPQSPVTEHTREQADERRLAERMIAAGYA